MPPENEQVILDNGEIGNEDLEQWLTSIGDGAEIQLPGLDIGVPISSRNQQGISQRASDDDPFHATGDDEVDDEIDDGEPGGDPEAGTRTTPTPTAPTANATDEFVLPSGVKISREDAERLYNFDQFLRANPDKAARVNQALIEPAPTATPAGGQPPVSTTTPPASETTEWKDPEPPEWMDMDDPQTKWQWDNHVAQSKALFDRDERDKRLFAQQAQDRQEQNQRQAVIDTNAAVEAFKQAHPNLNEDDIAKVRQLSVPFIDGMLKSLPPVQALGRAMDVAAAMDDDLRVKVNDPTVRTRSERQTAKHRKNRLGEISGTPRSAPKIESRPQAFASDKDFLNSLAEGFNEAMQR